MFYFILFLLSLALAAAAAASWPAQPEATQYRDAVRSRWMDQIRGGITLTPAAQITGYRAIDGSANRLLPSLRPQDQAKIRKELKRDADRFRASGNRLQDRHNLLHKLRELVLGAFLARRGSAVEYERRFTALIDGKLETKTPDWTICGPDSEALCIVELANFHGDVRFEEMIRGESADQGPFEVPTRDTILRRLYAVLEDKSLAYKGLVNSLGVPYVVALELEFPVSGEIDPDDLLNQLDSDDSGLFARFPELSGVMHFADADGYRMRYEPNPGAQRPISMPQGW